MFKEKARLFGKKYTLKELYKIEKNNDDPDIEFLGEDLDYICDCMMVDFFEEYNLSFRWRKTGYIADVLVRRYGDGGEEIVSVYHHKAKKQ